MSCLSSSSRALLRTIAVGSAGPGSRRALTLAASFPSTSAAATYRSRSISGCPSRLPAASSSSPSACAGRWAASSSSRPFSVQPARPSAALQIAELTEPEYAPLADETMHALHDSLEELVEGDAGAEGGWEVEYSESMCKKSGVLTLSLGDSGTYVINKQPPNKQIWLSSPTSGPKRYNWSAERRVWFNARDDGLLQDLLEQELSTIAGRWVTLDFGHL